MPRIGVSFYDVSTSIEALRRDGLNPTVRRIRERIGSGSMTTIAAHKRAFNAAQHEDLKPAAIQHGAAERSDRHEPTKLGEIEADVTFGPGKSLPNGCVTTVDSNPLRPAALLSQLATANTGWRTAERAAAAATAQIAVVEDGRKRLMREVSELTAQNRLLTAQCGEVRGRLSASERQLDGERRRFERAMAEKDDSIASLNAALDDVQQFIRDNSPRAR